MTPEEAQERTRKEQLAQLGGLLAGFAHEVRNPLSTIGLNLQLVKEDFEGAESSRDRRTYKRLSIVESEVKRLQTILEEFLGFVRTPKLRRRVVDVNELLESVADFNTPEMRKSDISLKLFPGQGVGKAELDPDQIRAVLVNLLRNAREACEAGDEILIASRRAGDDVLIQVTDTGSGMDEETSQKVFQPYFSTKKGGTGLGLAMARRIIEGHGGVLSFTSEPGKGTQFSLRLPVSASDVPSPGAAPGEAR